MLHGAAALACKGLVEAWFPIMAVVFTRSSVSAEYRRMGKDVDITVLRHY